MERLAAQSQVCASIPQIVTGDLPEIQVHFFPRQSQHKYEISTNTRMLASIVCCCGLLSNKINQNLIGKHVTYLSVSLFATRSALSNPGQTCWKVGWQTQKSSPPGDPGRGDSVGRNSLVAAHALKDEPSLWLWHSLCSLLMEFGANV